MEDISPGMIIYYEGTKGVVTQHWGNEFHSVTIKSQNFFSFSFFVCFYTEIYDQDESHKQNIPIGTWFGLDEVLITPWLILIGPEHDWGLVGTRYLHDRNIWLTNRPRPVLSWMINREEYNTFGKARWISAHCAGIGLIHHYRASTGQLYSNPTCTHSYAWARDRSA